MGYPYAAGAIVCYGSYLLPYRFVFPTIPLDPVIYQLYVSFGIFLGCWASTAFLSLNDSFVHDGSKEFLFSSFGMLAGVMTAFALHFHLVAANQLGLLLTQGVSAWTAALASYIWGVVVFNERPRVLFLSVLGMVTMMAGITLLTLCRQIASLWEEKEGKQIEVQVEEQKEERLSQEGEAILFGTRTRPALNEALLNSLRQSDRSLVPPRYYSSIFLAAISGMLGGSLLAPMHYATHGEQGLVLLPALGVGALVAAPLVLLLFLLNPHNDSAVLPPFHAYETLSSGMGAGMLWSAGALCTVAAIDRLGYGLAVPMIQTSALITALWATWIFGELAELRAAGLVLIAAAGLLGGGAAMIAIAQ